MICDDPLSNLKSLRLGIHFKEKQDNDFHLTDDRRVCHTQMHPPPPRDDLANLWLFSDNLKTMDGRGKQIKPSYMSFSFYVTHDVQF